jgi:hypothetical protein
MKTRSSTAVEARFVLAALLVAVVACANVWGFEDLTVAPADGAPATAVKDGGQDGEDATGAPGDDATETDAGLDSSALQGADAETDGAGRDSGLGGSKDAASDGAANDGAAVARCQAICTSGCCDAQGICQGGTATSVCGAGGAACVNCSKTQSCPLPGIGACCTSGACGCSATCGL